ncbi:tetratricopeptide repeat protein [Robertmurraya sp. P23]|uniref:tetratricopeptide repeat protein n=1 Tax=Robertmurraya sp. P23 TaxID=3436931 RepID=UPI003D9894F5
MTEHHYRGKYVFSGDTNSIDYKVVELYERLGVETINDKFNLAIQYHQVNRNYEALDLFEQIIEQNPSKGDKLLLYEKMGDVLFSLREYNKARIAYESSLKHGNDNPRIYRRMGELFGSINDYGRSIYFHEKALVSYFSYEWIENEDEDFLYFTNYYSLAINYSKLNNHDLVITNAKAFLDHYGDFDYIRDRYFREYVYGDSFIPEAIESIYKLLTLTLIEKKEFQEARIYIEYARVLSSQDIELAKIHGFIDGKLESSGMEIELAELKNELLEKDRALMILVQDRAFKKININIGEVNMGNKFNVVNNGTIGNQVFGDNVTFNNTSVPLDEVNTVLSEIIQNLSTIGNEETQNLIEEIKNDIKVNNPSTLKTHFTNLLVNITSGCITNNMQGILTKVTDLISKLG